MKSMSRLSQREISGSGSDAWAKFAAQFTKIALVTIDGGAKAEKTFFTAGGVLDSIHQPK
jgi:ABC-type sulfate transport system substrate-binding protein